VLTLLTKDRSVLLNQAAIAGATTLEQAPRRRSRGWIAALMLLAVVAVVALALLDQKFEAEAALQDYAREQVLLARTTGRALAAQLRMAELQGRAPAAAQLLARVLPDQSEFAQVHTLALVQPPNGATLYTASGRAVQSPVLQAAIARGAGWLLLQRAEAQALGLPARSAVAGIARAEGGALGRWNVAVVASAARERDRAAHARWRSLLSVLLAAAIIVAFGGALLRAQRAQWRLERVLELAALREERDGQLARESRAATMLTLAAGVAHEVSTPLNVIAGRAEQLLAVAHEEERVRRPARAILDQSQRIREVVRGFLDLARGHEPVLQDVAPHAVVSAAVELVLHRFEAAGVALSCVASRDLPAVSGDARLLEQALVNLLLNACDACARGGRVQVQASASSGAVQFVVEDDGVGISEAHAARVLEPFFSTKPHAQGSGLGLAVTKEIVAMHRGTLQVEASHPRGTRAAFVIPVGQEPAQRSAAEVARG
jgi:signal transduction histidine kinase